jgi:hypothetical protein
MKAACSAAARWAAVRFDWLIAGEAMSQAIPAAASNATAPPAIHSLARFDSLGWTTT